jgi:DNA-binding NarL/FixJ family response regulator
MQADALGATLDADRLLTLVGDLGLDLQAVPLVVLVIACSALARATLERLNLPTGLFDVRLATGWGLAELASEAAGLKPSVAVIDVSCSCGLDVVDEFEHRAGIPVVAVEAARTANAATVIARGATGYLTPGEVDQANVVRALLLSAGGYATVSRAALTDIAATLRTGADAALPRLTDRQRSAITLAAAGRTNREIARELSIEVSTVKKHLSAGFASLGVTSRGEVAAALRTRPLADGSRTYSTT